MSKNLPDIFKSEQDDDDKVAIAEVFNTVPYKMIPKLKQSNLEVYADMTDEKIVAEANPSPYDHMIKKSFWKCYNRAVRKGERIVIKNMLHGVCSASVYTALINNPAKLVWLMRPVTGYTIQVESLLDRAMTRYEELIGMSIETTKKIRVNDEDILVKEVDAKKATVLLSVLKNLEERVHGSAVQRAVSVKTTEPNVKETEDAKADMNTINARLKEMEEKLGDMPDDIIVEVDNEQKEISNRINEDYK